MNYDCQSWLQQGSLTELQHSNVPLKEAEHVAKIVLVPSSFPTLNFSAAKNDNFQDFQEFSVAAICLQMY